MKLDISATIPAVKGISKESNMLAVQRAVELNDSKNAGDPVRM
jgi:hypothetical protein